VKTCLCIGGPLDGEIVTAADFYTSVHNNGRQWVRTGGQHREHTDDYIPYIKHGRNNLTVPGTVYIHKSILKESARGTHV
jgi:hypothetical protein